LFFFFSRFNIYFLDFYLRQIIALVFEKVFINSFYKYAQGFFGSKFRVVGKVLCQQLVSC